MWSTTFIKIKTLDYNTNKSDLLLGTNNIVFKIKFKKFIIIRSPFKYKKTREQYALKNCFINYKITNTFLSIKLFNIFYKKYFWYSNSFFIKIKQVEFFKK